MEHTRGVLGWRAIHEAGELLRQVPWPSRPAVEEGHIWCDLTSVINDPAEVVELPPAGPGMNVAVRGRISLQQKYEDVRIWFEKPGPIAVEIISLTPGFSPFLTERCKRPDGTEHSNTEAGDEKGYLFHMHPSVADAPENWIRLRLEANLKISNTQPEGEYLLHVWQPWTSENE